MPYFGSLLFFGYFFYFLVAITLAFFIPGYILIRKIPVTPLQKGVLALVLGMVLWGLQGFIFGYLHMRWLSYAYLALFFVMFLSTAPFRFPVKKTLHIDWVLSSIIGVGVILQLLGVFFMGARISRGMLLCCGYVPDSNLELSLISEITKRFPPFEPGMYGQPVQNYHYWSHLVIAELVRVFQLPLVTTTYQYSTLFYSILFGLLLVVIAQLLHRKAGFTRWLVFFAYFGGDASYLVSFFQGRGFHLPVGSMENGAQFFFNYPRALSIIVFLGGFSLFLQWIKDKKLSTGILMALVLGSTVGFKVYTGLFVVFGALAYGLYLLTKKQLLQLLPLVLMSIFTAVIYFPVNGHAGGLFYTGFWRVNDFMALPNLHLSRFELARQVYERAGNKLHVLYFELLFTILYLIDTFGTKLIGLFQTKDSLKSFPVAMHVFFFAGSLISFVLGMFFWETTGGPNTFNFLVTLLILGCFYSALAADYWTKHLPKFMGILFAILIIILTIPRVWYATDFLLHVYNIHTSIMQNREIAALEYLREKTPSSAVVIAGPDMSTELFSPYLPYMSQRASFLSGITNELDGHGIDHTKRSSLYQEIFTSSDSARVHVILHANTISYFYMTSPVSFPVATTSAWLHEVFNNGYIKILKVQ